MTTTHEGDQRRRRPTRVLAVVVTLLLSLPAARADSHAPALDADDITRGLRLDQPATAPRMRGLRGPAGIVDDRDAPVAAPRLATTVYFDTGSARIKTESHATLDEFGKAFQRYPDTTFVIEGHTDSVGAADYNLALSGRRARAVADYLDQQHGVDPARLELRGYGETRPIASNETTDGRARNRRVEFVRVR